MNLQNQRKLLLNLRLIYRQERINNKPYTVLYWLDVNNAVKVLIPPILEKAKNLYGER